MRYRQRASLLNMSNYSAPSVYRLDASVLNGGLNLKDLDYEMPINQSPDLLNMYWNNGYLMSRGGQEYATEETTGGAILTCFERLWFGKIVVRRAEGLYSINPLLGSQTLLMALPAPTPDEGVFFVFNEYLLYASSEYYLRIDSGFNVYDLKANSYIPTVIINRLPDGTGGSIYQGENRIQARKTIKFTTNGSATAYHLPESYAPLDPEWVHIRLTFPTDIEYWELQTYTALPSVGYPNIYYKVGSTYYTWNGSAFVVYSGSLDTSKSFTVNRTTGVITFNTAPAQSNPNTPSNLVVTFQKLNADAYNAVFGCKHFTTITTGINTSLSVVCGGCDAQPNAFFWSGSTDVGLDPSYFPMEYYNLAGATEEIITGFGHQQAMLVIFKERSVGKATVSTETINDKYYINLVYSPINSMIGCNLSKSIQLIDNNLTFANTYGGVFVLGNTSSADENNIKKISRNVEGDPSSNGLLYDLRRTIDVHPDNICSYDDGKRYWLNVDGLVYVWDYDQKGYTGDEKNLSWYLFDNIYAKHWCSSESNDFFVTADGKLARMTPYYNDFGEPISRRYTFATQNFGTYRYLKDVLKIVFSVRSDTGTDMNIKYVTDYEERYDLTPIRTYSFSWVPRDLSYRRFSASKFAGTFVRVPRCFHIRHFSLVLLNDTADHDMSLTGIEIFYRFAKEDR